MLAQVATGVTAVSAVILLLFAFAIICVVPLVLLVVLGFASGKVQNRHRSSESLHHRERRYHQTGEFVGTHPNSQGRRGLSFFVVLFFVVIMVPLWMVLIYASRASNVQQQATIAYDSAHEFRVTKSEEAEAYPQAREEPAGPFDSENLEFGASEPAASDQGWASSDGTSSTDEPPKPAQPQAANSQQHLSQAPAPVPQTAEALFDKQGPAEDRATASEDTASAHAADSHSETESVQPRQPSTPGFVSRPRTKAAYPRDPLNGRPLWLDNVLRKTHYNSIVSSQRFATREEASKQAYTMTHEGIEKRIREKFPELSKNTNYQLSNAQLDDIVIEDRYVETLDVSLNPDLTVKMYRVHFLLNMEESTLSKFHPFWRQAESTRRSWIVMRGVSVGFAVLAGLAMLLNIPYVTKRSHGVAMSLVAIMAFSTAFLIIEMPH